jgi:hypothetical protein
MKFLGYKTTEEALESVKRDCYNLQYVHNQTEEICLAAVKQNGHALQHVHNQTEEICLAAAGEAYWFYTTSGTTDVNFSE